MIGLNPFATARAAANAGARPATTIIYDSPDLRLVVFRILPGQRVAPHRSASTVMLTVLEGAGFLSGENEERACAAGDIVCYEPRELHGMRAETSELHLLASITPRPGSRTSGDG